MIPTGHLNVKDRSATGSIGEAHFASEPVDDLFDDTQAQAGAALLPRVPGIGLRELLKYERLEVDWDAGTMIAHRKAHHVGSLLDRNHHFLIHRRKLDCV